LIFFDFGYPVEGRNLLNLVGAAENVKRVKAQATLFGMQERIGFLERVFNEPISKIDA
jgi:hypothetical protein